MRAFWPAWTIFAATLGALMLGWHETLPLEVVWVGAVAAVLGGLGALGRGIWTFRWPRGAEALARVDAELPGRPIATLADDQAIGADDPASQAVWRAHQARMAERLGQARAVEPDLRLSRRDRFGLRYMALLLLSVAILFGSILRVGSVAGLAPQGGVDIATGPVWEGWIEPPSYTARPSIYLGDILQPTLQVPEGSRVTVRFYGDPGDLRLVESLSGRPVDDDGPQIPVEVFDIAQSGVLSIEGSGGNRWEIIVEPDAPPTVDVTGTMDADGFGEMRLPFRATDDHAVLGGTAQFALDLAAVDRRHGLALDPEPRAPVVIDLPVPFAGDRSDFEEILIDDFSQHPFANLPVEVTLTARDALGQTGTSETIAAILPGRRFFEPLARSVIEQRRDLLWSRDNALRISQVLRAVSHRPDDVFRSETSYLRLRFIARRLETLAAYGLTDEAQTEIAAALWDLAIELEEGTLADALDRLRRAQERLEEAMRNGASDEEIAELMDELRQAMDAYMRQLAQNAEPGDNGLDQPDSAQNSTEVTQDELQAMLDRIEELMREGRMAEAQALMEQLQEMMENMRVTQGEGGENGQQGPGQQALEDLAETLRDQQQLSDDSFQDLQDQFSQNGQQPGQPGQQGQQGQQGQGGQQQGGQQQGDRGSGPGQPGAEGDPGGSLAPGQGESQSLGQSLADRQEALRDELNRQQEALPFAGSEPGDAAREALDRAGEAMDGAEEALRDNDLAEAIDRQSEAMDALREGLRNLGEAMAENQFQQEGQGQQQGQAGAEGGSQDRDPLGRQAGLDGQLGTRENLLQGEDIYRRAEEILDEIRRRAAEQDRPQPELDYLRRLLDRF